MIDAGDISLVVSTYNWPEALLVSLESVRRQSALPREVIVADDGSDERTRTLIEELARDFPVPLRHVWHADEGFRKTIIMNLAVRVASAPYIVQTDGDIVLHRHFIRDHAAMASEGYFVRGGRMMLPEKATGRILAGGRTGSWHLGSWRLFWAGRHKANGIRLFALARIASRRSGDIYHVKGCNMAYWKADFVRVNGYNNDITGWGHEDVELAARLHNAGVAMRKVKFAALCCHLHHGHYSRGDERANFALFEQVVHSGVARCERGYDPVL